MDSKPTDTNSSFFKEQLAAQRGMLTSAIAELKDKNEKLEKTLTTLQQRNNEISQISYRTYHDMRGPMVTLLGVLDLVRHEVDNETVESLLQQAEVLIKRLDEFSASLSSYTNVIHNDEKLEPLNIQTLFEEVKDSLQNTEGFSKVNLYANFKLKKSDPTFIFDKNKLHTLLKVFIGNSIRYRDIDEEDCYCKVTFRLCNSYLNINIIDNGMGIEEEAKPRIFDMFFRGTETSQGPGLGLYIANNIIKEAKGTLQLTSKEGEGTSIVVEIPRN